MPAASALSSILEDVVKMANIQGEQNVRFPLIVKKGVNLQGKQIRYYFNHSAKPRSAKYVHGSAVDLLSGTKVQAGAMLPLALWGVGILEENQIGP